jgi:hypothetical protein
MEPMRLNLPEPPKLLDEIGIFEREWTDHHPVELAILLYDHGVSVRKIKQVIR